MGAYVMHVNMMRGEITPLMHARVDSELYQAGVHTARNFVATRYGGMVRAPGFIQQGALKSVSAETYMVPFVFNRSQVYAVELSHLAARFWNRNGQVIDGGSPYTVVLPYDQDDLSKVRAWQSGDVLYLACDGYQTRRLIRRGETDWTLEEYTTVDGPFLPTNGSDTTLKPSDYGSAIPTMTTNTAPSGTAAGSSTAFRAFDRTSTTYFIVAAAQGYLSYEFGGGVTKAVDGYWLKADELYPERMPAVWRFQGYDGTDWITLDTQSSEHGFSAGEVRFYSFQNSTAYEAYQLIWTATGDADTASSLLTNFEMHEKAENQTSFSVVANSTMGVNNDTGFAASDVGRHMRLFGSDGQWRWAKITTFVSTTEVKVQLYAHALPDLDPVLLWRLGAWSDTTGWPKAIGSYENRVGFANTDSEPFNVWLTKSAGYDNHSVSEPLVDDDAVTARPNPSGLGFDPVNWLLGTTNMVLGTEGNLKAIGPRDAGKAFGPTNVRQLAANSTTTFTQPGIEIGNVIVFFDAYGTRMYEAAYSSEADGYVAVEVSVLNAHLLQPGVKRYAYQSTPHKVLWAVLNNGDMVSITYDRDQKAYGVTRREVSGTAVDVICLPGPYHDDVFVTTIRDVNGSPVGYMELLAPFYDSTDANHTEPVYYDCARVVTGSALTEVTDASHLEGRTVGVWVDGRDVGDAVVAAGAFTLPNSATGDKIVYGLRLTSYVKTLKLVQWGQRDGGGPGRQVRIADGYLSVYQAAGLHYGTEERQDEWRPEVPESEADPATLYTGDIHFGTIDDTWKNGGVVVISNNSGYPSTLRGVTVNAEGTP